jgi:tetratricopeptide (TPR) repeat protein
MHVILTVLMSAGLVVAGTVADFDVCTAQGKNAFAQKNYRMAAEHFQKARELAAGKPDLSALAANNLGSVEYTVGRIREAVTYYREALSYWERMGAKARGLRTTLRNLASSLHQIGEYEEARRALQRLSHLMEGDAQPDRESMRSMRLSLARIEEATGNPLEAEKHYQELMKDAGEEPALLASVLDGLGDVQLKLGRFAEAEKSYREAMRLWEEIGSTIRVAASANRLGDRWLNERQHRKALPYLERALAIFEQAGVTGPQLVSTMNNIAQAHRFGGDRKAASERLERALAVAIRDLGAEHPMVAAIELNIGDLKLSMRKYDEAEAHLRQALAIQERRFGGDHPEAAIVVARIAKLHTLKKQYHVACEELGSALAMHERSQIPLTVQQAEWFEVRAELLRKEQNYAEAAKLDAKAMRIRVKQLLR